MSDSFLNTVSEEDRKYLELMREVVLLEDKAVSERVNSIMKSEKALTFEEKGVFKYGLAKTAKHYTFHSMVMYANPDVVKSLKKKELTLKFQKGCINFSHPQDFPLDDFKIMMQASAQFDFSGIINHYKTKKK